MIRIETDCLEELYEKITDCLGNTEEAFYCLRATRNELIQDELLSMFSEVSNIEVYVTTAIQICQKLNEMLNELKIVLAVMPEEYRQLEKQNKAQLQKIEEFILAYTENYQAITKGSGTERIGSLNDQRQSVLIESLLSGKANELPEEELAAITRILRENYQFEEVIHENMEG